MSAWYWYKETDDDTPRRVPGASWAHAIRLDLTRRIRDEAERPWHELRFVLYAYDEHGAPAREWQRVPVEICKQYVVDVANNYRERFF